MQEFNPDVLREIILPKSDSHKGQNGKLMLIGGSKLFHAAALWALDVSSRFVDMVYFSSIAENNDIVKEAKKQFRNGIVVPRTKIDEYIQEADCVLIGPGLPRLNGQEEEDDDTAELTKRLLLNYPDKKWVIDGGSLQTIEPELIPKNAILTPHQGEFEMLFQSEIPNSNIQSYAKKYNCTIVLKGETDIVCSPEKCVTVSGGNAGMTKGGTGDVLAGVAAALYCTNDSWVSACAASFLNKRASERLFEKQGYWYNSSDLVREIPQVMKEYVL